MPRRAPSTACRSGSTLPASCNQLRTCMAPTAMRTADAGLVSLVAVGLDACRSPRKRSLKLLLSPRAHDQSRRDAQQAATTTYFQSYALVKVSA